MDSVTPGSPCFLNPLKAESLCPTFYHSPLACHGQVWRFGDNAIYALKTDTGRLHFANGCNPKHAFTVMIWVLLFSATSCNCLMKSLFCYFLILDHRFDSLLVNVFPSQSKHFSDTHPRPQHNCKDRIVSVKPAGLSKEIFKGLLLLKRKRSDFFDIVSTLAV